MMLPIAVTDSFEISAPPETIWPFIADTDRMNRRLGLKGVKYTPLDEGTRTAARLTGATRMGGLSVKYEEMPWEWTWTRGLAVRRTFQGGPIEWLDFSWKMEAAPKGSKLHVKVEALPRHLLLRPLVWINLRQAATGMASLATEIEA